MMNHRLRYLYTMNNHNRIMVRDWFPSSGIYKNKEMIYIYKLMNQHNQVIYIGQTKSMTARLKQHQANLRKNKSQKLYTICHQQNWSIDRIEEIARREEVIIDKLTEVYYILDFYLHSKEPITNSKIESFFLPKRDI